MTSSGHCAAHMLPSLESSSCWPKRVSAPFWGPLAALHPVCPAVCAGLVGAGTNNARLAGVLRGLSSYYYKEPTLLLLVRLAQGLVHLGKGLLTLAPARADGTLVSGEIAGGASRLPITECTLSMSPTWLCQAPELSSGIYCLVCAVPPGLSFPNPFTYQAFYRVQASFAVDQASWKNLLCSIGLGMSCQGKLLATIWSIAPANGC